MTEKSHFEIPGASERQKMNDFWSALSPQRGGGGFF